MEPQTDVDGASMHPIVMASVPVRPYYSDESFAIYNADAMYVLPYLMNVGAFITDPPYSINTKSDGTGKINPWADYCNWALFYRTWIASANEPCVRMVSCGAATTGVQS